MEIVFGRVKEPQPSEYESIDTDNVYPSYPLTSTETSRIVYWGTRFDSLVKKVTIAYYKDLKLKTLISYEIP